MRGLGHCGRPEGHKPPHRSEEAWARALRSQRKGEKSRRERVVAINEQRIARVDTALVELVAAVHALTARSIFR